MDDATEQPSQPEKMIEKIVISATTGEVVTWTRENDGVSDIRFTELNAVMIIDSKDRIVAVYAPTSWLQISFVYSDEVDDAA